MTIAGLHGLFFQNLPEFFHQFFYFLVHIQKYQEELPIPEAHEEVHQTSHLKFQDCLLCGIYVDGIQQHLVIF